jgi:hypothetical protein
MLGKYYGILAIALIQCHYVLFVVLNLDGILTKEDTVIFAVRNALV